MLRKLRRNSKEPYDYSPWSSKEMTADASPVELTTEDIHARTRLTFFDLPAELRNEIYALVISDTTLSLPANLFAVSKKPKLRLKRRKSCSAPPMINGLLLASRQCNQEYSSFLLSNISVVIEVKDFDFENLIRVSKGLGDFETNALRSNRHLTIMLNTRNCTDKDLQHLRRWLEYRRDDQIRLPWKYGFAMEKLLPSSTMGKVRLQRELEYYSDSIACLDTNKDDETKGELSAIREAFEREIRWIDDDLSWLGQRVKSAPRHLRGLAGGGLH